MASPTRPQWALALGFSCATACSAGGRPPASLRVAVASREAAATAVSDRAVSDGGPLAAAPVRDDRPCLAPLRPDPRVTGEPMVFPAVAVRPPLSHPALDVRANGTSLMLTVRGRLREGGRSVVRTHRLPCAVRDPVTGLMVFAITEGGRLLLEATTSSRDPTDRAVRSYLAEMNLDTGALSWIDSPRGCAIVRTRGALTGDCEPPLLTALLTSPFGSGSAREVAITSSGEGEQGPVRSVSVVGPGDAACPQLLTTFREGHDACLRSFSRSPDGACVSLPGRRVEVPEDWREGFHTVTSQPLADVDGDGRRDTLLGLRFRDEGVIVLRSVDHACTTVPLVAREAFDDGLWQAGAADEEGRLLLIREAAETIHLMRFVYDGARGAFVEDGRTHLWPEELQDETSDTPFGSAQLMNQIELLPAYPSPLIVRTRPGLIGLFRPSWADGRATLLPLLSITRRVPERRPEPVPVWPR
ncbi:MAG: hypothetical protein JWM10_3697 [Myxococcaceae bacterium]|nr:hypothetical protein [Myxococcaceae bacterium]